MRAPYEPSYTVDEFCNSEGISEATYFKLKKAGLAPKEMRYLSVVRITHQERLAWQKMMQTPPPEQAALVEKTKQAMQAKGRDAAGQSIESPKHVSN